MKVFKLCFLLLAFGSLSNVVQAVPKKINLLFDDRTVTLNFETQPELLQQKPVHFVKLGKQKIPIDMGNALPTNSLVKISTEFEHQINPDQLHDFLQASFPIQNAEDAPVHIGLTSHHSILFDGVPKEGFKINEKKLVALINNALKANMKNIQVPSEKVFSKVTVHDDLKKRGIKQLLAIGHSNFSGSASTRRQNIKTAAQKYNGHIVRRGSYFSFNSLLGPVDEEHGFASEYVIKGNELKKEPGGGVCQVSTTAFRAAFAAGLPITERRNHSYSVPYYKPVGLDAAIYLGALDLRFRNDTPGEILIQSFTKGDNIYFAFYGNPDNRKVIMEGPFISNIKESPGTVVFETDDLAPGKVQKITSGHMGFRTEWIRKIQKDGKWNTESFVSNYRAWPEQYFRGREREEKITKTKEEKTKKVAFID